MTPAERRDAIVSAALAVALRKGLGATTVRDVAAEMGTSSGLIHHYFDSMDEVLAAAFDRAAGQDLEAVELAMQDQETPVAKGPGFFRQLFDLGQRMGVSTVARRLGRSEPPSRPPRHVGAPQRLVATALGDDDQER